MKQISAVLLVLAILNPLCCCLALGEGHVLDVPMKADHSCCNSESKTPDAPGSQQDAANCEHDQARDFVISAKAQVAVPCTTLVAQADLLDLTPGLKELCHSAAVPRNTYAPYQSVPRWVEIQTDCVRRL